MANRTVTIKSSGGDYASLNTALGTEDDSYADLVTNTMILTFECYGMADTTAADTGTGWTTSSSYYLKIEAPAGQCHTGARDATKYRLSSSVNWGQSLKIQESYTVVKGLQIKSTGADSYCIRNDGAYSSFINLLSYDSSYAGDTFAVDSFFTISNANFINCVSLSCDGEGFICSGSGAGVSIYLYNCVAVNCGSYGFQFNTSYGYNYAKNCYSGGNGGDDYWASATVEESLTTCYSEDGTLSTTTAAFSTSSGAYFTNVTAGSEDIHIGASSSFIGNGTDLHADAAYAFNFDVDGDSRPDGAWDIGADEYVAAGGVVVPVFLYHYMHH